MSDKTVSSLIAGDLEGVAWLCLRAAAMTDSDSIIPGSGDIYRHKHHERRDRFLRAMEMVKKGPVPLAELGLSLEDCEYAIKQAHLAKDQEGWLLRFRTAEGELRRARDLAIQEQNKVDSPVSNP